MTFTSNRPLAATFPESPFATAVNRAGPLIVPGLLRRAALVVGDLLAAVGTVLCVPFVILAIGTPIALSVRFLLWITGML